MYWDADHTTQYYPSQEEASMYAHMKLAHAVLMVLAFMMFMSTGIYFARYFRSHCPNNRPFGLHLWFHFHRTINMIAIALSIAGFACIFANMGWFWDGPSPNRTEEHNSSMDAKHCMVGLLACVIAWAQPLNAVFRCLPTSRFRVIFQAIHWFFGYGAWLLGLTAIVIALKNFKNLSSNPQATLGLMIAYLVTLGVLIIVNEALLFFEWNQRRRANVVMMLTGSAQESYKETTMVQLSPGTKWIQTIRYILFLFYLIVVALGIPIAICVLIGIVSDNQVLSYGSFILNARTVQ